MLRPISQNRGAPKALSAPGRSRRYRFFKFGRKRLPTILAAFPYSGHWGSRPMTPMPDPAPVVLRVMSQYQLVGIR